jgi:hypothetical protein
MKSTSSQQCTRWAILSLLNLVIVSMVGVLLRYKIAFSLPLVNYIYLLNAHSHFAFAGWISMAIFASFVFTLSAQRGTIKKTYSYQFNLAQLANFGMLFSFLVQGYGAVSISFFILSILFSYWFAWQYWKDLRIRDLPSLVRYFAKVALSCLVLSSVGPLLLEYILAFKVYDSNLYHNSIYLFLHFQYNGWFSFGVFGIFFGMLYAKRISFDEKKAFLFFKLLAFACVPAYSLSILWTEPPIWIFVVAALASLVQLVALIIFFKLMYDLRHCFRIELSLWTKVFWSLSLIAFSIKLLLQVMSVIPIFGRFAFGYRGIIIAYLHLVLLGFISFFLFGYFFQENLFGEVRVGGKSGLVFFVVGVLITEMQLVFQAVEWNIPSSWASPQILLFCAAILISGGLLLFFIDQFRYLRRIGVTGQD